MHIKIRSDHFIDEIDQQRINEAIANMRRSRLESERLAEEAIRNRNRVVAYNMRANNYNQTKPANKPDAKIIDFGRWMIIRSNLIDLTKQVRDLSRDPATTN